MDRFTILESIFGRYKARGRLIKLCALLCVPLYLCSAEAMAAVEIILKPTVTTAAGETVIVLGDKAELSSWNKAAGLPCSKSATTSEWTCQAFTLAAGTSYLYKYAKRNSSGVVTYEGISNRSRVAPTVTTLYLETWNVAGGTPVTPASSSQSSSVALASSSPSSVAASSIQSSSIAIVSSSRASIASSSIQPSSVAVVSSSSWMQSSSVAIVSSSRSSIASSAMASSSVPAAIQIILKPTVTTVTGETVIVLGDKAELSSWNKAVGLPCTKSATTSEWTCQAFTLAAGTSYLYKYAKRNSSGVVTYEGISNRSRTAPTVTTMYLETWSVSGGIPVVISSSSQSSNHIISSSSKSSSLSPVASSSSVAPLVTPAVPAAIKASLVNGSINVSWDISSGATSYEVVNNVTQATASVSAPLFVDTNVLMGKAYSYNVKACITSGEVKACSAFGSMAKPFLNAPATPSFNASLVGTSANLSWSTPLGATYFNVQKNGVDFKSVLAPTTTFVDPLVPTADGYTYRVNACMEVGADRACSGWSVASGILNVTPIAPASITVLPKGTEVSISWDPSLNATGAATYELQRIDKGRVYLGALTNASDAGLTFGQSYTYRVSACVGANCSGWANAAAFTAMPVTPEPITSTVSDGLISLTWPTITGATRYELVRNNQLPIQLTAATYNDSAVVYGSNYQYTVRACAASVCSSLATTPIILMNVLPVVPLRPNWISASLTSLSSATVSWEPSILSGITYDIKRDGVQIKGGHPSTNYADSSLTGNGPHTYEVRGCNNKGCSAWSYPSIVIIAVASPKVFKATVAYGGNGGGVSISLSWEPSAWATEYKVSRSHDGRYGNTEDGVVALGNITSTVNTIAVADVGTAYRYTLSACGNNRTVCSDEQTITVSSFVAPSSLTGTAIGSSIRLNWVGAMNSPIYKIYRNNQYIKTIYSGASFEDQNLTAGSYQYQVSACSTYCSVLSDSITVVMPPSPTEPPSIQAVYNGSYIAVSWDYSTSLSPMADDYQVWRNDVNNIAGGFSTYVEDANIVPGSLYSYSVKACEGGRCSPATKHAWVFTPLESITVSPVLPEGAVKPEQAFLPIPMELPTILLIPYDGLTYVKWSSSPSATSYILVRDGSEIPLGMQTDYIDNKVFVGSSHSYGVKVCNGNICSAVTYATTVVVAPASPVSVSSVVTGTSVAISWTPSAKATNYKVRRSDGVILALGNVTSFTDNTAVSGNTYTYSVMACIADSCSGITSAPIVNIGTGVPPSIISPANGGTFSDTDNPCFSWNRGSENNSSTNTKLYLSTKSPFDDSAEFYATLNLSNVATSQCWNDGAGWNIRKPKSKTYKLIPGVTYYWTVQVFSPTGGAREAPVSTFTITQTPATDSELAIRAVWAVVGDALKNNDRDKLTENFDARTIAKYNKIFDELGPDLTAVGQQLRDIEPLYVNENTAVYLLTKTGDNGGNYAHTITFRKDENGKWKVSEL